MLKEAAKIAAEVAIEIASKATLPEYVDKKTALKLMGRKETSNLHKLTVSGDLRTSKDGKIVMYETASIIEYLRKNKKP